LDSKRQRFLLDSIGNIQTIISCTGLEEFVNDRFTLNRVFEVNKGTVTLKNSNISDSDTDDKPELPADEV